MGDGEAFRYVVTHPGKHDFEAKNPGALYVAMSQAKSAGGESTDPDFAFHEEFLINDDRFKPVHTPTTHARAVEMERLRVLASQSGFSSSIFGGNLSQNGRVGSVARLSLSHFRTTHFWAVLMLSTNHCLAEF